MQTQTVQLINVSPEQLQSEITKGITAHLDQFLKNFTPQPQKEFLSRKEVATMFGVDISTVHNWTRAGKLRALGISGRVYYVRLEVEASLKPLKTV